MLRSYAGEVDTKVFLRRDGDRLKNDQGVSDLSDFVQGFTITESIDLVCMEAQVICEDAAGLIGVLTGTEQIELRVRTSIVDRIYTFRILGIENRMKSSRGSEVFILNCVSEEYIKNETVSVFGHSNVLFQNTEGSNIVKSLLKDKNFIGSGKRFFGEETLNTHPFIAPNFRPFDALFMVAQRSIRKPKASGVLQNGFVFYENALGFHFKSYDKLIEDIGPQLGRSETVNEFGLPRMYKYTMSDPSLDEQMDLYRITGLGFEKDTCYIEPLRNGSYCGYSIGFDPVSLPSSQIGLSEDMPSATYRYSLSDMWNKMEHLDNKNAVNPYSQIDKTVKEYMNSARRIRYNPIPNRVFDNKDGQAQATYTELTQLEAYEFARIESLKNVMLNIEIPGNLDLYAGTGIDIGIPASYNSDRGREVDQRYSGRYLIRRIKHNVASGAMTMTSDLTLVKDSVMRQKGQL